MTGVPPGPGTGAYAHGFARVAACTFPISVADPAANSGRLLDQARRCHERSVSVAVFTELCLSGYAVDDLFKGLTAEERVYRHRCVEAWSMVIPWLGHPLGTVLRRLDPLPSAKYVEFTTLLDPKQMPGQRSGVLPWPYVEALRIDEAMHPLTLMATGMYGKALPNQNGAPLRLVIPWKYGFKGGKSIVKIRFTDKQPATTWNVAAPNEYGFYANVNPTVDHPRWSQAKERRVGEFGREDAHTRGADLREHRVRIRGARSPERDRFDDRIAEPFPCRREHHQVGRGVRIRRHAGAADGEWNRRAFADAIERRSVSVLGRAREPVRDAQVGSQLLQPLREP